jgi:hypothetical protein
MTYNDFKEIIKNLQISVERSHKLNVIGLSTIEYDELYAKTIEILLKNLFNDQGFDWIMWYLYEKNFLKDKEPLKAYDENGNEICQDVSSLWDTVKPHLKL